ncbi:MAG: DUF3794 domain-containing protein [Clostridia bacterium]|nr:DUF3794 domain-containing protein [Clostridia bacterium]
MPELIKNYVKTSRIIPTETVRFVHDSDHAVPENMPDISYILANDAAVTVDKISTESDRITVDISIIYNILYMNESELSEPQSLTVKTTHAVAVSAQGIDSDCICKVKCCAEQTEITNFTGRRFSVRCAVKCASNIESTSELAIPIGIDGISDIQTAEDPYTVSTTAESTTNYLDISEKVELPLGKAAFKCLLKNDACISDISFTTASNELTVKGNLNVCTLYVAEDNSKTLQVIENQIPFSETIFIERDDDSVIWNVSAVLNSFSAEATEDNDGELRMLSVTAIIKIDAVAHETVAGKILSDAYSLSQDFLLPTRQIDIYTKCNEVSSQFVLKTLASVPEEMPEISEIVSITGQIGQTDVTSDEGYAVIEGIAICDILYISKDSTKPIGAFSVQIPFTQQVDRRDITASSVTDINLNINHTSFSILSPNETEIRIAITAQGEIMTPGTMTVITDISESSDRTVSRENQPSILLYIVQPGDSLWKIAKRYNAPIEILKSINNIDDDMIMPGQKLFIPKG